MFRDIYILWFRQLERNAVEGTGFRKNDSFTSQPDGWFSAP